MNPIALALTLQLTSGWPTVLDLAEVQEVAVADSQIVLSTRIDEHQVLLVGNAPGTTRLTVTVGAAGHPRRVDYQVKVSRWATFTPSSQRVEVAVDERRTLDIAQLRRVVSGDPTICEASLGAGDTLQLLSRRPGQAVLMLWAGGTDAAHRRTLVVNSQGGVQRTADDIDAILTEPLDGRLALIAGERARVPVPGTRRFESKDPSVAIATLHPSGELLVEARSVGATWVQTWAADGKAHRLWVVVNHHSAWDPHSIDWLLRLEAERRAAARAAEGADDATSPPPVEVRTLEAPGTE